MGDLLIWLTFEVIFGYLFYITGVIILRVLSFGKSKLEFYTFSHYRELKRRKEHTSSQASLIGFLFYAVLITFLVVYYSSIRNR